ncbi:MAG: serine hydrolase domain-containing protein [Chthoniobacterales bacterium]
MNESNGLAERLRSAFEENFERHGEIGAAVSVWGRGGSIFETSAGFRDLALSEPWTDDTLVLVWSATKGLAAACVLHAMEAAGVSLNTRVAKFWPEFGQCGKEALTVGQVLSHRAGLSALDAKDLSVLDHDGVARAIERQVPQWKDEAHGYGPRTFGFVVDEMVRRLAGGRTLGDYWRREFGDPLELDAWIGLPEEHHGRVAQMIAARGAGCLEGQDEFLEAMGDPASLTRRSFSTPGGALGATAMNSPAIRGASLPSMGGIATASALAKFYAMLANGGEWGGVQFFSAEGVGAMRKTLAQGRDRVLLIETAFSAGFMRDPVDGDGRKIRSTFGPAAGAFGHPGAGGSLAFADPDRGIGFAYVMNQMGMGVLPRDRAWSLVAALYESTASPR